MIKNISWQFVLVLTLVDLEVWNTFHKFLWVGKQNGKLQEGVGRILNMFDIF